jgi:tRNA(Ile2) C34 agmatinyltransferase TiaS
MDKSKILVVYARALAGELCPFCGHTDSIESAGHANYLCLHCKEQWDTSRIHDLVADLV